jgi:hypothetical protein
MPNKIKPKRSYTSGAVPTASDLETNEVAINWADSKAFTKNAAGNIVSVTLGGGSGLSWSSVPASATASGTAGQTSYDSSYYYVCVATNTWVRTALSTWVVPVITIGTQPSNQTASSGAANFSVSASVTQSATLSYQWQRSTDSGSTFAAISGATSSSLALTGLVAGDNGYQYRVVVSATGGATSVTSSAATLTVSAPSKVFSNVDWKYSAGGSRTFSVSGDTVTVTILNNFPLLSFTIPNATLTATRTSSGPVWLGLINSDTYFPGAEGAKDGYWFYRVVNFANSGTYVNLPAGQYWFNFNSRSDYQTTTATFTLVLS